MKHANSSRGAEAWESPARKCGVRSRIRARVPHGRHQTSPGSLSVLRGIFGVLKNSLLGGQRFHRCEKSFLFWRGFNPCGAWADFFSKTI
jgi:hypothetical protein